MSDTNESLSLVAVSAGVSDTSTTRMLVDSVVRAVTSKLAGSQRPVQTTVIELASMAPEIMSSLLEAAPLPSVQRALEQIAHADALIVASPIYKAGLSGLFKTFVDVWDNDLVVAKPTILAATAGTARHAMVVDDSMRSLFAFLRSLPVPTSLFATAEDWSDPEFSKRVDRAATELAALALSGVAQQIAGSAWDAYNREFDSTASRGKDFEIDFDTDLMRLAQGGGGK